ncbi:AsmA2 domain-containing protein YhdP [Edwardsiella piscicida]|nr:AsmA2 domain-containing protein YhdP [Edwardsiella piscicida]ELM3729111.1 AsmA2 domain-containing protein YhdP [Edwardsiella piscicida]ELV7535843.1 AsmA2 domain-containing protein YhdP [Edwardsiella piscicida]
MRRLPGYLLATLATLIVLVALLVSGLRLLLPHIDSVRPQIAARLGQFIGAPLTIGALSASWQSFGPTLEARDIALRGAQGQLQVRRMTLGLDVWQSLLHVRPQFRDLTFYQLQASTDRPLAREEGHGGLKRDELSNIFLRQFDHFTLRDSRLRFPSPSGVPLQLTVSQLTWLNGPDRHRAEGEVSFSTPQGQHGNLQLRMDLRDKNGLLSDGEIYLQADQIDLRPWLSRWINHNTGLNAADFSLASWLSVRNGEMAGALVRLRDGQAGWRADDRPHRLTVRDLTLQATRRDGGWQLDVPRLNLATDGQPWPAGHLSLLYLPRQGPAQEEALRLRATDLQLARITPLLPTLSFLSPALVESLQRLQPQGYIRRVGVDIPLQQPERSRVLADWHDVSWQPWKLLPGIDRFSGSLSGSGQDARLRFTLKDSTLPYAAMFRAPLSVQRASGVVNVTRDAQGWTLSGQDMDVQARALWSHGGFRYHQPTAGPALLSILAGIRLTDAREAWRYFPEPLMGTALTDYLSGALEGGAVENATLLYDGDPQRFPYQHHDGQFQVYVPLRQATFRFQPDWAPLTDLSIDLNFLNDGLWMFAPSAHLGAARGSAIHADIPQYGAERLLIRAGVAGSGKAVRDYFMLSPLKSSVGATLDELQVGGDVTGRLDLDIPLDGGDTRARGEVRLDNNTLFIKPLGSQMQGVSGAFRFDDGRLQSDRLSAHWLGQPLALQFATVPQADRYQVAVDLNGDWLPARLPWLPPGMDTHLQGSAPWQGKVTIDLPDRGASRYQVDVEADLRAVASSLPAPLTKAAGAAQRLKVNADGDMAGFTLSGSLGRDSHFAANVALGPRGVALDSLSWDSQSSAVPQTQPGQATLRLPPLDGAGWLALLAAPLSSQLDSRSVLRLPAQITLSTPQLLLGGQAWHQLSLALTRQGETTQLRADGREIRGAARLGAGQLSAALDFLYYDPQPMTPGSAAAAPIDRPVAGQPPLFRRWPAMQLRCQSCWFMGQNLGKVAADMRVEGDTLLLTDGLLDSGNTRLTLTGRWQQQDGISRTQISGGLQGANLTDSADFFGLTLPLKQSAFKGDYDLRWQGEPWQPRIETLDGMLQVRLGKGVLESMDTGRAGQLLRLVSFDALLRKLRLDFSDTFGEGFYFDGIKGHIALHNGVMSTDDLLIDGLSADVAMNGTVNLVTQRIDMQAVIAPELSATVGVATAFAVNPVVGAAVFAASKVLAPLWNKISLIRYNISGGLDSPAIHEVLRQPKKEKAQ